MIFLAQFVTDRGPQADDAAQVAREVAECAHLDACARARTQARSPLNEDYKHGRNSGFDIEAIPLYSINMYAINKCRCGHIEAITTYTITI